MRIELDGIDKEWLVTSGFAEKWGGHMGMARRFMPGGEDHTDEQALRWYVSEKINDLSVERVYLNTYTQKDVKQTSYIALHLKHTLNSTDMLALLETVFVFEGKEFKFDGLRSDGRIANDYDGEYAKDWLEVTYKA